MSSKIKTVSGKLIFATGAAITCILAGYAAFNAWDAKQQTETAVMALAEETAKSVTHEVAASITQATSAGTTLAASVKGLITDGSKQRSDVVAIIKTIPEQYETVYGAWMAELADIDSSAGLEGDIALNKNGIFTPYWTKSDDGGVNLSTWVINKTDEYYDAPIKKGSGLVTSPYVSNEGHLLTSVSVPLIINQKTVGLAGVDIRLNNLAELVSSLRPFDGGHAMLLANNGQWLTHYDKAKIMTDYSDLQTSDVKAALSDGNKRIIRGAEDGSVRLVYPFTASGMGTTWAVVLDVPSATFTGPVITQVRNTVLGGIIILVFSLMTIMIFSRSLIATPLSTILSGVKKMSGGDYKAPIGGLDRNDEFGTLANALEAFRHDLSKGEQAKTDQEALRANVESEREEQAAIENAKSEDLKQFVYAVESGFNSLADGDLTVRMNGKIAPEFETIRQNFNSSVSSLEETMNGVVHSVDTIHMGLGEISSASNDLARRTEQQAASLEETAAALGEVTIGVNNTAKGAGIAQETVASAQTDAKEGGAIVSSAVIAMSAIQESSSKIGNIISVIDEIAFQTNLLALNAGVEAARAGEAGKGFAVVAQEVRELAQRSASAAKEIKELITASSSQVEDGVELVSKSGKSLEKIVEQVVGMSSTIGEIAENTNNQASNLREVSSAADQMDQVTQQNAAMVEETSAAAQSLRDETENLTVLIRRFTTSQNAERNNVAYARAS